jgi:excisionase family DNA binding protein
VAAGKNFLNSTDQVMTADEVAELLRVHKSTIYRLLKAGKFPHFRMGGDFRFSREAIDEWRKAQEYKPSSSRTKAR